MNIGEYIGKKYKNGSKALTHAEAMSFGLPYPLQAGWFNEFKNIEITVEMHDELVSKCLDAIQRDPATSKAKSARKILGIFCVDVPKLMPVPAKGISRKQRKKLNALNREICRISSASKVAKNALKRSHKAFIVDKSPDPVQRTKEADVLAFHEKSKIDPRSDEFLQSFEWRSIRMMALKKHGPVCQCCGASPATGAVMHVDHIKPRKFFPHLALDVENLQILCGECNHGKGNWDSTDWRKKSINLT